MRLRGRLLMQINPRRAWEGVDAFGALPGARDRALFSRNENLHRSHRCENSLTSASDHECGSGSSLLASVARRRGC
jgi:hypothetical protein